MKIFNWVHRRFTHKDGLSQSVKKVDDHEDGMFSTKNGGDDTQVLLDIDNVVHLADFLDGWQGGVLTIGTFGRLGSLTSDDLLKQDGYEQEEALFEVDQLFDEEEEEEENPLVMNRVDVVEQVSTKCDPAAVSGRTSVIKSIINEGGSSQAAVVDEDIGDGDDHRHRHSNKWVHHHYMISKKERITLADLFSAELADGNSSKNSSKIMQPPVFTKKDAPKKGIGMGSQVFPKTKLIPAGLKDDSRPLKKLNQLMKKMLKRKIHPDASNYKDYSSSSGIIPSVEEVCNNDSVSLLQNSRYGM